MPGLATHMSAHDYGRQPIKAPPKATSGPSCAKCRHLRTDGKKTICGHWNAPAVEPCDQFADASKPRHDAGGIRGPERWAEPST